jgi:hypothetical protein
MQVNLQSSPRLHRRVQRSFWLLVTVSILAIGVLTSSLAAPPSHATGLRVASSGLILLFSLTLATRILTAIRRAERKINSIP